MPSCTYPAWMPPNAPGLDRTLVNDSHSSGPSMDPLPGGGEELQSRSGCDGPGEGFFRPDPFRTYLEPSKSRPNSMKNLRPLCLPDGTPALPERSWAILGSHRSGPEGASSPISTCYGLSWRLLDILHWDLHLLPAKPVGSWLTWRLSVRPAWSVFSWLSGS